MLTPFHTNIIVFNLTAEAPDAPLSLRVLVTAVVLVIAFGARTIRLVTHLDVSRRERSASRRRTS
jgi:hypothetical protein